MTHILFRLQGYRVGDFSYDIPMPNGNWNVTVHSSETVAALIDTRTFSVKANGRLQLKAWGPDKVAGGALTAANATFKVKVTDGYLRLQFEQLADPALVAAISVSR